MLFSRGWGAPFSVIPSKSLDTVVDVFLHTKCGHRMREKNYHEESGIDT